MEGTKTFRYCSFSIILMIINGLFLKGAKSEVYRVGDEAGWNTDINFVSWSQKYNFSVGDVLVFKYANGQHNAYEVTEATYRSCDASSGVLAKYEGGNDQVKLIEAKKYWFICNVAGHCLGGMRFSLNVNDANANTPSNSTNGASTPQMEPPTPLSNSCITHAFESWSLGSYLVACGILLKMYC